MSKKKTFERKGDWPRKGGSFVRQSNGALKALDASEPEETPAPASKANSGSKDSGK